MIATVAFIVAYFAIDHDDATSSSPAWAAWPAEPRARCDPGRRLLCIGAGAIHWAKTLMPDEEVIEERHPLRVHRRGPRRRGRRGLTSGGAEAQLGRRPLIKYTLGRRARPASRLPLLVQLVGSPRPVPSRRARAHDLGPTTLWPQGPIRLMRDPELTPIKASDVTIGSVFHVMPESSRTADDVLEEKAKAAVSSCASTPTTSRARRSADWGYRGDRRLLQDLHPRRLPRGPLRAADPPPALPVPPVDLRRHAGLRRSSSARPSGRCRSCRSPSTPTGYLVAARGSTSPSARASGSDG